MTSLKCLNSGVESNGAAFILFPSVNGFVSRVPGASGKEVSSSNLLSLASQFSIRHATTNNLFHDGGEPLGVRSLPAIVPKRLFVQITEQVEGLDADVCAVQPALEQAPEVLHRIGVNVAVDVLNSVIDDGVPIVIGQTIVRKQFVTEDRGASLNALADLALQFALLARLNVLHYDFAAAFNHSENNLFADWSATLNHLRSLALVHIAGFCADESFIDFHFASELVKTLILHGQPNAMEHEPRRLLRDAKPAMNLVTRDTVLAGNNQPCRREPLLKRDRRVLENGPGLERERGALMLRVTLPHAGLGEPRDVIRTAARAGYNAIRPAKFNHKLAAVLEIGEVQNRVPECVWRFHESSMQQNERYVKYVIALILAK
jgi:hypothetical protein